MRKLLRRIPLVRRFCIPIALPVADRPRRVADRPGGPLRAAPSRAPCDGAAGRRAVSVHAQREAGRQPLNSLREGLRVRSRLWAVLVPEGQT